MKKILRISTYPTSVFKSMGRNSYMISGMESVKTTFVTPEYPGTLFPAPRNTSVVKLPFLIVPAPKGLRRVWHEVFRLASIVNFSTRAINILLKENPDIVHIHSPMFFLIALFARFRGKRCYITFHGGEFQFIYNNLILGRLFNFVFAKTFSLSENITNYRGKYEDYAECLIPIENAVDRNVFFDRGTARDKTIIAVGRLEKQKNYPLLLASFRNVIAKYPGYCLLIVGSGQDEQELKRLAAELEVASSVNFLGQIDQDRLPALYNQADVFVLCSLWEGFPKALLEAMASGCKVVATRVDSVPRILGREYPFLVKSNDVDDLSSKLFAVIEEGDELRSSYSESVKRFSWGNVKSFMEKEYNR